MGDYPIPSGLHPAKILDLRSDNDIDDDILHPKPVCNEKNIWFFWHSGYENMYPYTQRNVRAWFRRFSPHGWTVRVVNCLESSPMNVANFVDVKNPENFPKAFIEKRISGPYAMQHTSDLVRWPLLLKYGGVYTDVGFMQIGDLDALWNKTIGDPESPFKVLGYNAGFSDTYALTNYFMASGRDNPFFQRCHRLLLALWNADGGKVTTEGMHSSPLLKGTVMQGVGLSFEENGKRAQVITMVMGLVDEQGGWNGPDYVNKHIFAIEFKIGSQWINEMTGWNGPKQFELMSLRIPRAHELETADQKLAREIIETCLRKSFGWKLGHGIIFRMLGHTLGTLWRSNPGSDIVPGTYAAWLRYGMVHWNQDHLPERLKFQTLEPFRIGPLLGT